MEIPKPGLLLKSALADFKSSQSVKNNKYRNAASTGRDLSTQLLDRDIKEWIKQQAMLEKQGGFGECETDPVPSHMQDCSCYVFILFHYPQLF